MRAAGQVPDPRPIEMVDVLPSPKNMPRPPQPMMGRLQKPGNITGSLGARTPNHPVADVRECHQRHQAGHIARNCTQKNDGAANVNNSNIPGDRLVPLAAHKTDGIVCETSNKSCQTLA